MDKVDYRGARARKNSKFKINDFIFDKYTCKTHILADININSL